jgi:glucokinase
MNKQLVIALDVGGSSVKSAVVAATSRIEVAVSEHSIDSTASAAEVLETFATVITGHLENCTEVRGIGVAFPGPFDYEQGILLIQGQQKYDALYGLHVSASLR